jgi:hypothetical protein
MHDLTLLIQLFGREVMDGLLQCGFDTNDAIAHAGPELLAEEAEIPLPLARRIVAVAMESQALDEQAPPPAPSAGPAALSSAPPASSKKPARGKRAAPAADPTSSQEHVRRPLRRPHSPLTASPATKAGGPEEEEITEPQDETPDRQLDREPFVDDAGLVSWMGFSSRTSGSRMISVADTILDLREQHADEEPAPRAGHPALAAEAIPLEPSGTPSRLAAPAARPDVPAPPARPIAPTAPARPIAPASAARPLGPAPSPRESRLVGGSFWSFGGARRQSGAGPAPEDAAPDAPPAPAPGGKAPRRRSSDGS